MSDERFRESAQAYRRRLANATAQQRRVIVISPQRQHSTRRTRGRGQPANQPWTRRPTRPTLVTSRGREADAAPSRPQRARRGQPWQPGQPTSSRRAAEQAMPANHEAPRPETPTPPRNVLAEDMYLTSSDDEAYATERQPDDVYQTSEDEGEKSPVRPPIRVCNEEPIIIDSDEDVPLATPPRAQGDGNQDTPMEVEEPLPTSDTEERSTNEGEERQEEPDEEMVVSSEDEQPNTQIFRRLRTRVEEHGDVRMAHFTLDMVVRAKMSRDQRIIPTSEWAPPAEEQPASPLITPAEGDESPPAEEPQGSPLIIPTEDDEPQPTPEGHQIEPGNPETWPEELKQALYEAQRQAKGRVSFVRTTQDGAFRISMNRQGTAWLKRL